MALGDVVKAGCETYVFVAAGGSAFYFVKGALRSSSKGCRLAGGFEEVTTNGPHVRRWAAWFGVLMSIEMGMVEVRQAYGPLNVAAAWGGANALFAVQHGPVSAVREGLKGAAYSLVAGLAAGGVMFLLKSPESSDC
ncbi:hypothetical protein ACQ4PT_039292 [Festuca glaucescens]